MLTDKQTEANRRNAQKSTGPRTAAGKNQSRLNAFRHGLTGQLDIMPDDVREAHDAFIARLVLSLQPAHALENQLAHSIAESYWRLNRIPVIENTLLAEGDYVRFEQNQDKDYSDLQRALSSVRAFVENPARFALLTVYETRLHRKAQAELKQLREIQAERRAAQERPAVAPKAAEQKAAEPPSAAAAGAQMSESTDRAPENGFVFSDRVPDNAGSAQTARGTVIMEN
jgi:hypothetical protein